MQYKKFNTRITHAGAMSRRRGGEPTPDSRAANSCPRNTAAIWCWRGTCWRAGGRAERLSDQLSVTSPLPAKRYRLIKVYESKWRGAGEMRSRTEWWAGTARVSSCERSSRSTSVERGCYSLEPEEPTLTGPGISTLGTGGAGCRTSRAQTTVGRRGWDQAMAGCEREKHRPATARTRRCERTCASSFSDMFLLPSPPRRRPKLGCSLACSCVRSSPGAA